MNVKTLKKLCKKKGLKRYSKLRKKELIKLLIKIENNDNIKMNQKLESIDETTKTIEITKETTTSINEITKETTTSINETTKETTAIKLTETIETELKDILEIYKNTWFSQKKLEEKLNRNIPFTLSDIGTFGELLNSIQFNCYGGGSKGGCAFDLISQDFKSFYESKTICLIQPKICKNKKCKIKVPFFQKKCICCNQTDFQYLRDSRAGIDVDAHFKYDLKYYFINIIDYNIEMNKFTIETFKISSVNKYFKKYLHNQFKNSKSNTANLLPYKYDFYCSGPIKIFSCDLYENNININFSLDNNISEKFPINLLYSLEKEKYLGLINYNKYTSRQLKNKYKTIIETSKLTKKELTKKELIKLIYDYDNNVYLNKNFINYDDIKDKLCLRNKKFNKLRGIIKRKV